MAASRAMSETGTVVNTKFGARPIIDLPAFAFGSSGNFNSNLADAQPRMFGPSEYSYNVGRNVPRDHSNGGYIGQYYNVPSQSSPRGYQNPNSNFVKESNVIPYPSYTTIPNMASQQPPIQPVPPIPPGVPIQSGPPPYNDTNQPGTQEKEVHLYYGPNGERLPGPPSSNFMLQRPITKLNPSSINFKIEATLEYGKMVSVRIKEGNVSFRDIPDFVISDCKKTYRVIPKTDVTIVAEQGDYRIYAAPDLQSQPLDRLMENIYDPYIRENSRRRVVQYPQTYSPSRRKPDTDIYTKKYDRDYADDSFGRRRISHTVHSDRARVEPRRQSPQRHWYSSDNNRAPLREYEYEQKTRDPQRIPLPMRPMHLKKVV